MRKQAALYWRPLRINSSVELYTKGARMAYVGEPFVHDVFVSYSHGERDPDGQYRLKQWSIAFARELERELRQFPHCGHLSLFIDQHRRPEQALDPMLPLTDQLEAVADAAATLVVLASPWYRTSRWCEKELKDWFAKQPALGVSSAGRVAVVRTWHPSDPLPANLVDKQGEPPLGFYFYDRERAEVRPQPYAWPAATETSMGPFREQLLELAGRLHARLKMMREQQESRRKAMLDAKRLGEGVGQLVYLHGRDSHEESWKRVRSALTRSGLVVVPAAPEPVLANPSRLQQIRQHRVQTMSGCDALLLVSADDGWAVDADLVVVGRHDRSSARAVSNRPLPCALIDSVGCGIATETRRETARDLNVQWIDATRDPWTPSLRDWLGSVAQAEAAQ